ncbi:hypothetical protein Haur_5019 (plasmid) [Herpetosiphon aurantiacus DSM 785]|uniref:Uncharacterized protein n=1 Tax=Herpetosiphon aurantiacus (strain ATCC 23779 / DSM 785 / 114-95) TaxID=316274 RepID=A9B8I5_HERA2|nr:hypothetical protein Haur_5019 [Herpetosiphon aurantiacus DSM 785]
MTPLDVNMTRRVRLAQVSRILQLAVIIREEESVDDDEAYTMAEALLDEVNATADDWGSHQPASPLGVIATAWGLALRRNGTVLTLVPADLTLLREAITAWEQQYHAA